MISMEMMGKIRRMYFRDKLSLHEIAKRTGLARNTIRKWVRAPEAKQPVYQRRAIFQQTQPFSRHARAGAISRFAAPQATAAQCQGAVGANQSRRL